MRPVRNDADRVPTKGTYQYDPNFVRDTRDLRAAPAISAGRSRVRMDKKGRRRFAANNPGLLSGRE
jgi:hypothetical protein